MSRLLQNPFYPVATQGNLMSLNTLIPTGTNWSDAPSWANYKVTDKNGDIWWFEQEPIAGHSVWFNPKEFTGFTRVQLAQHGSSWLDSLETKPEVK